MQRRLAHQRRVERPGVARPRAHRAAPAVLRRGVVELLLQGAHEAAPVLPVLRHRLLLAPPQRGDALVALGVVLPAAAGARVPRRAVALDRALDVEHLQHRVDAALAEVDLGHQRLRRRAAVGDPLQHAVDQLAARERLLDEEVLDPAVLPPAQQHDLGALDRAPRTADLLVVGDDAAGRLVVDDEAEVGLVVAHPQRAGGDHRLEVVAQQPLLDLDAGLGRAVPAVGLGGDPVAAQPLRHQVGVALGERVDDPRARQLRQVLDEPGEPVGLAGEVDDLEAQAGAAERPAVGAQRGGAADAQLLLDVADHAVVGGRGRAQHRHALRQPLEHVGDPPVVGPEVVAPVGDAVRLVDHQQPDPLGEQRQHLGAEGRVVEPLGADQEDVDGVGAPAAPAPRPTRRGWSS